MNKTDSVVQARLKGVRTVQTLVGIDIQPIREVESSLRDFGARYTQRVYTEREIAACGTTARAAARGLAEHFAAKEAVMKVLKSTGPGPNWKTIEVKRASNGRPRIDLSGRAAEIASEQGLSHFSLSLGHGGGVAMATVVAQIDDTLTGRAK